LHSNETIITVYVLSTVTTRTIVPRDKTRFQCILKIQKKNNTMYFLSTLYIIFYIQIITHTLRSARVCRHLWAPIGKFSRYLLLYFLYTVTRIPNKVKYNNILFIINCSMVNMLICIIALIIKYKYRIYNQWYIGT